MAVSALAPRGFALTGFGDILENDVLLAATIALFPNVRQVLALDLRQLVDYIGLPAPRLRGRTPNECKESFAQGWPSPEGAIDVSI